ncbi:MAG: hypothetical protein DMF95_12555 [Acidobacteria bacterium]|nr:MAG: hypothetical protein DMF94_06600 [Acidobacteriota bacterium]PYR49285.1 MAG: hypothetical protein DMF95_12555 [Acidobacteriota bacterium]
MIFWSHVAIVAALVGTIHAASPSEDETVIRTMVDQAVKRLNNGDLTAIEEFWDEGADYVGVDGKLIKGRTQIQALFREAAGKTGQQTAAIEQIRFITPEIATVDGTWTVTGARDATGQELPPIKGRGFEVVQKKSGRWRFILTREMVIFG